MRLTFVAHEHFVTQTGKKSKPALMGLGDRGPRPAYGAEGRWSRAEKKNTPNQANLKPKLPRGGEIDILHWNIVCSSISSQKQTQ